MTRVKSVFGLNIVCICILIGLLWVFPPCSHGENEIGETGDAELPVTIPENSILSGAATYTYQVAAPPGRNGLGPRLALTYNSQRKSGWVGMGWDLDMGYIQRSTTWGLDYASQGTDPAKPGFVVSMNGSTTELVRRTDWDSNGLTCYGAKIEGAFTRYCRTETNSWEATAKDGVTYYYGRTYDSRQEFFRTPGPGSDTFKWCLDKVQDTNGNYMTMSYQKPMDQIYLSQINYNFRANGSPANRIVFTIGYMPSLEEISPNYTAGYELSSSYKLTQIDVYGLNASGNDELAKSYGLVYNTYCPPRQDCSYPFSSMLQSITRAGSDGTTLRPVVFTYQWHADEFTKTPTNNIPVWFGAKLYNSSTWKGYNLTGDFNGDGRTDIVSWDASGDYLNMNLSALPGSGDMFRSYLWPHSLTGNFVKDGNGHPRLWVGDFNGDGLSDVATIEGGGDNGKIWIYMSTGSDFADRQCWNDWTNNTEKKARKAATDVKKVRVGDFNGDGLADMISWLDSGHIRVYLSKEAGNGFDIQDWEGDFSLSGGFGMMIWLGDFNGDGKTDIAAWDEKNPGTQLIMHMSNGSGFDRAVWLPTSPAKFHKDGTYGPLIWLGDFNGDGKTDIASWNSSDPGKSLWIHSSMGTGFKSHQAFLDPGRPLNKNPKYGPWLGDFDGDGRTDIATIKNGTTIDIYRSMGYEFQMLTLAADVRGDASNGGRVWLGDFDGDGRTDIAGWNSNDPVENHMVSLHMHSYHGQPVRYLLSKVDNGLGGFATVEYKSSSACNDVGEDFPYFPCFSGLPFNVPVVSRITVGSDGGVTGSIIGGGAVTRTMVGDDSGSGDSVTTYDYDGAFYTRSAREREFYGFKNIRAADSFGTQVETTFLQSHPDWAPGIYKGLIDSQVTKDQFGKPYKDIRNFYQSASPASGVNFPHLDRRDEYVLDGRCTLANPGLQPPAYHDSDGDPCYPVETSFAYDGYGNVTGKFFWGHIDKVRGTDIPGDERFEITSYSKDAGLLSRYILDRPWVTEVTDSAGAVFARTTLNYYPNGNLRTKTEYYDRASQGTHGDPVTSYTYDAYGNKASVTDPMGNVTRHYYDAVANTYPETTVVEGLGLQTNKTWDYRYGKPLSETDYNGRTTYHQYDNFGRIWRTYQPPDSPGGLPTRQYTYNLTGVVGLQNVRVELKVDDGRSSWKETYFDGLGRTVRTRKQGAARPIVVERAYDSRGLLSKESLPHFDAASASVYWTKYAYDPVRRVTQVMYPDGTYTTTGYDRERTTLVDASFHSKVRETDGLGRLTAVHEFKGNGSLDPESPTPWAPYAVTGYTYNPMGKLTATRDARNNVTEIRYDSLSRKYYMKDPDMGEWTYGYDAKGNLTGQIDGNGRSITFAHDGLNRVTQKTYVGSTTPPVVYTYDLGPFENPKGKLTAVTDASGSAQFSYDERGRTKGTMKAVNGVYYTILTAYDSRDRVTYITYPGPNPETVSYLYDNAGNLAVVQGSLPQPYAAYTDFNANGQPRTVLYGNGVYTAYNWDPATTRLANLTTVGTETLQSLGYLYYNAGNVKTITDGAGGARSRTFYYDEMNRLVQADSPVYGTISYAYDEIGNMTGNSRVSSEPYVYPQSGQVHAVTYAGPNVYTYDPNGNMTSGEGRTFAWDYDNRPASINGVPMVYDHEGKRVKKGSTLYVDKFYECTVGSACTTYIFAGKNRIAKKTGTSVGYYHPDHLGSSNIITGDGMARVEEIDYYPYGEIGMDVGSSSASHKFTGQEWDSETGLYYYGARYYNPVIGRFISADTTVQDPANPQTLNRYSYVGNNPIHYVDPNGKAFIGFHMFTEFTGSLSGLMFGSGKNPF